MVAHVEDHSFAASQKGTASGWHYEANGKSVGPVSINEIEGLIGSGAVDRDTLVWKQGQSDWKRAIETELEHHFMTPPPVLAEKVNNTYVWVLAFAPAIGAFLEGFISGAAGVSMDSLWWVTLVLNIILCAVDNKVLGNAGYDTSKFKGWLWLVPVYMFQRAKALNQGKAYFIVWLVTFFLYVIGVL